MLFRSREGSNFQADPLNNARTVLPRTTKFGRTTHAAEERILEGSHVTEIRNFGTHLITFVQMEISASNLALT